MEPAQIQGPQKAFHGTVPFKIHFAVWLIRASQPQHSNLATRHPSGMLGILSPQLELLLQEGGCVLICNSVLSGTHLLTGIPQMSFTDLSGDQFCHHKYTHYRQDVAALEAWRAAAEESSQRRAQPCPHGSEDAHRTAHTVFSPQTHFHEHGPSSIFPYDSNLSHMCKQF